MKYQYTKAKNPTEFSVFTGNGLTPLDLKTVAKDIPCQSACPAKTNVPEYIERIFNNDFDGAYRVNQEDNVFPGVLGRVCTRPCEDACRHNWTNVQGPVQICHLKRTAGDNFKEQPKPLPKWFNESGKTVAVIGGGPAGLTAARELVRYGHKVTLFEREDHLGGMMIDGIPKFRLPREEVNREIDLIIDSGITVEYNYNATAEKIAELEKQYDAVLISVGTMIPQPLQLEGIEDGEAYYGLDFMKDYNNGSITEMHGDVVIVGGGFTAVDCARSSGRAARKLLSSEYDVNIVYRRSEQFMAANEEEMNEIRNENIDIRTMCTPQKVVKENGKIAGVVFTRNVLEDNKEGKPKMIPVPNSEFTIPCKHLIMAIGQKQEWSVLPEGVEVDYNEHKTTNEKIFVSGDFRNGGVDVITAVSDGKEAADKIDAYLMGEQRRKLHVGIEMADEESGESGRFRDHDLQTPHHMPTIDLKTRAKKNAEVETGLAGKSIEVAASRCYLCHYKYEIDQDKCIHCDWCIEVAPRSCIHRVSRVFTDNDGAPVEYTKTTKAEEATYIYIDSDECVRCGKCLRACPVGAISMRKMERKACAVGEI